MEKVQRLGWWICFDEPNDTGEIPPGFFVDEERAVSFHKETGWLRNHLEPVGLLADASDYDLALLQRCEPWMRAMLEEFDKSPVGQPSIETARPILQQLLFDLRAALAPAAGEQS